MAIFEVQGPDGKTYEVDAPDAQTAANAISQVAGQSVKQTTPFPDVPKNPDGTYGQPPEGFVLNPATGQMEDLRSPNNPNIPQGRSVSAALGAGQGLGFGGFDETVAAGRAATGDSGYDYELARMREMDRRAQEQHPGFYYAGMIPGAVASSVSAGKALGINPTGKTMIDTMARGAGIGGGEGFIWGALTGEGGAGNRAKSAIANALIGAGVGASAPPLIAGASWAGRKAGDMIGGGVDAVIGRANTGRANRSIMDTLRKSGQSADDVATAVSRAAQEGQPEFRLMDATGKAGQRRASGIVRSGGDGAEELAQFLETRQIDQPNRVAGFVEDAFGFRGKPTVTGTDLVPIAQAGAGGGRPATTSATVLSRPQRSAAGLTDALKSARTDAADLAYSAARQGAGPVDVRGALAVIDDRIGGMQGSGVAGDGIDSALARFRNRLAAKNPAASNIRGQTGLVMPGTDTTKTAVELSDFGRVLGVKQDVDDAIGAAVRAGRNNEARELGKLKAALDSALEQASPAYRQANDQFAKASRVIGAVDQGAGMARTGARAADTVPQFQAMTPEEQAAARVGYGDRALAKIEANAAPTSNAARQFNSTKMATEADEMALDPQLFRGRIGRENAMWETQNRALGGSRTADNLSDVADVGALADAGRVARDALTGRIGTALGGAARMAGNAATGQNEATRTLIAKMLMSSDPKAALAQALRQESTSQGRRRIAEAMARALGREFSPTP